jgi:hypothetical protein
MTDQPKPAEFKLISAERPEPTDIHGAGGMLFTMLQKAAKLSADEAAREGETNQGVSVGKKSHLIEKLVARDLRDFNATHAICIDAKVSSTVGLGHRERDIHDTLDPLCRFSWQDTLDALAEDYFETGEGFLEVVWDGPERTEITGLHHIESAGIHVEVEEQDSSNLFHYIVEGETGDGDTLVLAKWGDLQDLRERFGMSEDGEDSIDGIDNSPANDAILSSDRSTASALGGSIANSEVIHIRQATNRSRYYGYPDYMSAVPSIELVHCMTQHEFDFYFNRGVPEFLLFLLGKNIGGCWSKIETMLKANQGIGNSHKSQGVHIPGDPQETTVQVEKLAMEDAGNSGFTEKSGTLDMRIATAHGMPPQLANIALPGKIGGANEGPNAMLTFQMRKLGQAQKNFSGVFANTLGGKGVKFAQPEGASKEIARDVWTAKNAKPEDDNGVPQFVQPGNGFATILDGMTLGARETMNEMKEPLTGSDRNVEDGKLEGARDRKPGDSKATRKPAASAKPATPTK